MVSKTQFFLEVIDPNKPFFAYVGKVRRYIEYSDAETWKDATGTKLSEILVIGDTVGTQIRFQKQAARFLGRHYDEGPKMYTTNASKLGTIVEPYHDRLWRNVEEPGRVVSLDEI